MSFTQMNSGAPFVTDDPWRASIEAEQVRLNFDDHETRILAEEAATAALALSHKFVTVNGAEWELGVLTELITLDTGAAFTDSAANLLPGDALIEAVVARVITTITTAASWSLGDALETSRFTLAQTGLTAGTTVVGLEQHRTPAASSPTPQGVVQDAAAKLRITLNANPGAGVVRVSVFFRRFVAPVS